MQHDLVAFFDDSKYVIEIESIITAYFYQRNPMRLVNLYTHHRYYRLAFNQIQSETLINTCSYKQHTRNFSSIIQQ